MFIFFVNISVKTGNMYSSQRKMPGIYTFAIGHPLIIIDQSIHRVLLVQFGNRRRELLYTFVFKTLGYYEVIIPGGELKMQWRMPIDVTKPQTKYQVDSVSVTMRNVSIFVSNNICDMKSDHVTEIYANKKIQRVEQRSFQTFSSNDFAYIKPRFNFSLVPATRPVVFNFYRLFGKFTG